jgi:WhiB family transcriptional regulator, redox-sensing transcriptional regulator
MTLVEGERIEGGSAAVAEISEITQAEIAAWIGGVINAPEVGLVEISLVNNPWTYRVMPELIPSEPSAADFESAHFIVREAMRFYGKPETATRRINALVRGKEVKHDDIMEVVRYVHGYVVKMKESAAEGSGHTFVDLLGVSDSTEAALSNGELAWQDRALCAETDPEAFFPEKGGSTREAKRVCRGCEVRSECLEYALEHDEKFGIWGGLSERERSRLRRGNG